MGWQVPRFGEATFAEDLPAPRLAPERPHDVIVDVEAAATNFADSLMIDGRYQERPDPPFTPGIEVAGTIRDPGRTTLTSGTRVVGLTRPGNGSWAEQAICDARQVVVIPDDVTATDAVALYINAQTAWFALHERGALRPNDVVLVHAAAGGVGAAAIQLARANDNPTVIGTSSPAKIAIVEALGVSAIDNRRPDWPDQVRELVGADRGVDVVIDPVGGAVFGESIRLLRSEGRHVIVGFASGDIPTAPTNHLLVKNITIAGLYWTHYTLDQPERVADAADAIWELHRKGSLDPLITEHRPMSSAHDLAIAVASGATTGKCIVSWGSTQPVQSKHDLRLATAPLAARPDHQD